nr:PREDICTED: zinc finger CCHC domain-containing protein 8 homolog isoform X1 [Megachile rotundata]
MNSAITIEDIDEEVIDLDSSQDAINDTDNDQSECSIEKNSLSNNIAHGTNITNENIDNNKGTTKLETCIDLDIAKPLIKVMFRDENIARQYSKKITKFLGELVSSKIKNQENDNGLTLEIWDNDIDSCQSIEITTESEDSQDIICDTLFTVDTQPKIKDDFDVPTYGKKYENAFEKVQHKSDSPKKNDCSRKLMCFNCLENHNLRDCPNPRNQTNIDKNRKNFNMKNSRALRYHLEDDQKFGHLIPGQLSSNLRKALGLKSNELPKHIYRMRELGYPPGWLEEARLQHSGLSLFNSDGVPEDDPNDEPGEIIEGDRDQYDIRKIYDFPGFNVPPPPGTHDEYVQYWESDMRNIHSKQTMLSKLRGKKADDGYKRKKLKISNNSEKDNSVPVSSEMEIEDVDESVVECIPVNGLFIPPLPLESTEKLPEPPVLPSQSEDSNYHSQEVQFSEPLEESKSPSSRANSPSLSDLENMKKQLLVELQETNSQSNSDISSKSNSSNSVSKSDMPPPSNEVTPESNRIRTRTSCGSVKSVDLGTPVLQSTSPYSKLPSSEKFSKDICDVINFENLPNSTGKYKQMSGVLQKVRTKLAKLHE